MNVLLERSEATAKYRYRVVGASRGSTLREEIEGLRGQSQFEGGDRLRA
jgi:hypothetical protein